MRLICAVLRFAEGRDKTEFDAVLDTYERRLVVYHIRLCNDAGYLREGTARVGSIYNAVGELTWQGHDALEELCTL
ncbi:MAG: DUF2513 domain-containing protein [bacterium]|nr:DUF2513 domain-containing protein [bacterium]MDE0353316.1 DUF2513 domain-containing protein [bacterium]